METLSMNLLLGGGCLFLILGIFTGTEALRCLSGQSQLKLVDCKGSCFYEQSTYNPNRYGCGFKHNRDACYPSTSGFSITCYCNNDFCNGKHQRKLKKPAGTRTHEESKIQVYVGFPEEFNGAVYDNFSDKSKPLVYNKDIERPVINRISEKNNNHV